MNAFWFAFWFFLPAGLANTSPVFLNKIPFINRWNTPIDFGKQLLGANKKWRGVVGGIIVGILSALIIYRFYNLGFNVNHFLLGGLLGFGALAGDAVESFFKRRAGVKEGESWFPFDQIDYIIGGILASLLVVRLSFSQYLLVFVIYFGLHLITSYVGYLLKLKSRPI